MGGRLVRTQAVPGLRWTLTLARPDRTWAGAAIGQRLVPGPIGRGQVPDPIRRRRVPGPDRTWAACPARSGQGRTRPARTRTQTWCLLRIGSGNGAPARSVNVT